MREEVIVAGYGGQGILFMGTVLANAAMEEGLEVTFFPCYGAEIRGGTANGGIVISDKKIGSPVVTRPTSVIIMNEPSYDRFFPCISSGGTAIINSSLIKNVSEKCAKIVKVPASQLAEALGDIKVANMILLGAYLKEIGIVPLDSAIKSLHVILKGKKKGFIGINEKALRLGTSDEY